MGDPWRGSRGLPRRGVLAGLGPNGAGKTTTVRLLTALIEPSEGRATVDGLDVVERPDEVRARVGILTETPGLYDKLSATANLEFFGRLYGLDAATRAERTSTTSACSRCGSGAMTWPARSARV